jgi:multicomponent Na+:H+ antiporter subunit G
MIGAVIIILSALFTLLAAIGLVRMPDLYTKMHAVSKAGAFGGSMILLLAAVVFGVAYLPIIIINIIFFYFTTPVAAQMIAKSALSKNVTVWKGEKPNK